MQKVFDWILDSLIGCVQWLFYNIFDSCFAFIKILFNCFKSIITGRKMTDIGISFFGFVSDSFDGQQTTFNIVYVLVGFSIFFFVTKHLVIPLVVAFINAIVDALTPLS